MRILLVDNYDSFTYNLFHLLAEVTGDEPTVLSNDDPHWRPGMLAGFDAVVLSPGPGRPDRAEDFGLCTELVEHGELPTLGVCLGHQGMAHLHGGTVARAPEPVHGRVEQVHHRGQDLFAGLPTPFAAVRYHSLTVTGLPPELEPTAWTADGLLMGLRHRYRPQWGVQFHPESACSEQGGGLVGNFVRLAEAEHGRRGRPLAAPRRQEPARPAEAPVAEPAPARRLRVLTRAVPLALDEEQLYDRMFRGGDHAFWLDSSAADSAEGRFSIMGDGSGPLARTARADTWTGTVTITSADGEELVTGDFLDWLDQDLRTLDTRLPELPGPFALGWVGYLGYGLKAQCGGANQHRSEEDDAVLVFTDRAVVVDHATGTAHLLALAEEGSAAGSEEAARRWLESAESRLRAPAVRLPGAPAQPVQAGAVRLRHERDRYLDLVAECQQEIAAGETYEVCLTNQLEVRAELDPWQAYRRLRRISPAPFGALLQFGAVSVLSTSPERFLRVSASGVAESSPIKGTRPRGRTAAEDRALRQDLAVNRKDRAENLMILDLVRNDLGRCAESGTVEVAGMFQVRTFERVHQLVSTVRARLRPESGAAECVRAAFPPGSMTGAPKRRTMELIDRLEQGPRGIYSGAIGYFSLSGAADLSVVIRTAVVTPGRVRYGTGGAVIALSDPAEEWEETAVKAAPLLDLVGAEFPGRVPGLLPGLVSGLVSDAVPARR
ncbi:aminodeoxychorismate synthase component I [Streptacidiphilus sp. N1-12]|uniref:aminodeoxychorismate synthase n=2 Tax=Streptacidiphilus alkalitolerans TaxID=3342712 RepID=A0ABV6WKT9_9ACTN